jgi:hypothetical protein
LPIQPVSSGRSFGAGQAVITGSLRSLYKQRLRSGPIPPAGMPKVALIWA